MVLCASSQLITFDRLQESSALHQKLCNSANSDGSCNYSVEVELDTNLECDGEECKIDNPIVVMIQDDPPIYYECE